MSALPALLLAAATALSSAAERRQQFLELLRTYPERPPAETFTQVGQLIDQGDFSGRDRAEYWIGSASLASGDRDGARQWFARLARDYSASVWAQRSWLGLGDASAQEGRYGAALAWYTRAQAATDPAVRELGRISASQAVILRARQRWAFGCAAFACGVALWLLLGARHVAFLPLPAELRILWPVLAVLALLSSRVDAAPRAAILTLCAAGAALTGLSGLRLRATGPRGLALAVHVALTVGALGAVAYAAIYRGDLVGMVLETFRAGPE